MPLNRPLLILMAFIALFGGCHDAATTWSAESRSPEGGMARDCSHSAVERPGNAYDATVQLTRVKSSRAPMDTLVFSHQYPTMNLRMEWVTPTHFDVAYGPSAKPGDHVSVDFQVVKVSGIEISVHELQ